MDVFQQLDGVSCLVVTVMAGGNAVKSSHGRQDGIQPKSGDILGHKAFKKKNYTRPL